MRAEGANQKARGEGEQSENIPRSGGRLEKNCAPMMPAERSVEIEVIPLEHGAERRGENDETFVLRHASGSDFPLTVAAIVIVVSSPNALIQNLPMRRTWPAWIMGFEFTLASPRNLPQYDFRLPAVTIARCRARKRGWCRRGPYCVAQSRRLTALSDAGIARLHAAVRQGTIELQNLHRSSQVPRTFARYK